MLDEVLLQDGLDEIQVEETHGIHHRPENRFLIDSGGLGWRDIYTSMASEGPWAAMISPVQHLSLAMCVGGSADVSRRHDGRTDRAILSPRLLGTIPNAGDSHWRVDGHADFVLFYFRKGMVSEVGRDVFGLEQVELVPFLGAQDPLLEQLSQTVIGVLRSGATTEAAYAETLARTMVTQMIVRFGNPCRGRSLQAAPEQDAPPVALRRIRDMIRENLEDDLSLERIAGEAGMSPSYLPRAFKRFYGVSPHRYVVKCRIDRAQELLRRPEIPIVEVALATGFASQSHLTTVFRQETGLTPAAYRRQG